MLWLIHHISQPHTPVYGNHTQMRHIHVIHEVANQPHSCQQNPLAISLHNLNFGWHLTQPQSTTVHPAHGRLGKKQAQVGTNQLCLGLVCDGRVCDGRGRLGYQGVVEMWRCRVREGGDVRKASAPVDGGTHYLMAIPCYVWCDPCTLLHCLPCPIYPPFTHDQTNCITTAPQVQSHMQAQPHSRTNMAHKMK